MSEIEVWVQADVLSVRTTLVPKSRSSALETMLLKAIRKGAAHADDLCDIFGLAPRLVEGILGDLWRAGRISIDLGTEREEISLTSAAREELDALGEDGSVSSTAGSSGSEEVAHDRLTGRVLPLRATRRIPAERGLVVPTMTDDPDPSDLRESDLAEAVTRTLSWRAAEDASVRSSPAADAAAGTAEPDDNPADWLSDMRIDTAYLAPALLQASRERRYIPLRVQAVEDATGALTVRVTDDRLPLRTRELAARRLNGLIADRPTSRFISQLRGNSRRSPARERDLGQLIADLQSVVNAQPAPDPVGRQRAHDRATALAHDIEAYTNALGLAEMNATVIASGEQHIAAVNEMLRGARRQVVIAVPWVKQRGVLDIRDALIAAVGGGVQVTLLWGIASGTQPPDPRVLATLDEIEEHARRSARGGALRYHRERGSRSHAKVVVADDRELLITSKNFLSGSVLTEVGLRLTVPKPEPGQLPLACQAISDVLQFLYDHTPDPTTAAQLIRTRGAFGPRQDRPTPSPTPLPRLTAAVLNPDAPPEHARAWVVAWQDAARALAGRAARTRPTVEVIKDGQHAGLVREALEDARHRVLIASHRVSEHALTAELCELARVQAAKRVDVAVRYGEVMDETSAERLEELAAVRDPVSPDVQKKAGMHAKVVVRDSSTVLGSFNHLSVDAGVRGLRATGELSVRISSAAVGDEVWQALMERPPRRSRVPAAAPSAGRSAAAPAQLLLDLLEPADGMRDVDRLAELIQAEGTSGVLATAQRLGLGAGASRRVHAAAAIRVLAVPGADRDSRLSVLMLTLWETGAWACADLIRRTISGPGLSPRAVLTSALADLGGYSAALWAVVTGQQELTPAEAEAMAVSAAVGLLLGELDSPELVELLRVWERQPAPRSDQFVISAVDYWARYGPLPRGPAVITGPGQDMRDIATLRDAVRAALDSLRRYDTHSESGDLVRDYVFRPDSDMARLAAVLEAGDDAGLPAWEKTYNEVNDSRWLIKATKAAGQPPIDDHRKTSFIEKHRAIRLALKALIAAVAEQQPAAGQLEIAGEQLAELYRLGELAAATRDAASLPSPSPEDLAVTLRLAQLRARLAGTTAAARPDPGASLASWALPRVAILRADTQPADPEPGALLAAVCRDLAAGWTGEQAVRFLLDTGEFGLAAGSIASLRAEGRIEEDRKLALRQELDAARIRAEDLVYARTRAVALRCDRAGLDAEDPRWRDQARLGSRLAVALKCSDAALEELDAAVAKRKAELQGELAALGEQLRPEWAEHIDRLLDDEELAVASLALTPEHRNGVQLLPQPVQLSPWSWRSAGLAEVAAWFEPGCPRAPRRVQAEFLPEPTDETAAQVVTALRALAGRSPEAASAWMAAVQSLVAETDALPAIRDVGGGFTGEFVLPYDVRLPRLCWVGQPPEPVSVGSTRQREMLHFSLDMTDYRQGVAVVSVSDVLNLLGRDSVGRPASMSTRALRFLAMVCSQLPLDRVIAPQDIPAEHALDRRMALAWLLAVLGLSVTPADLDTLRLLGGGHKVPLWHLISAARRDPVNGVKALRDRPDLGQVLRSGLAADLDNDVDLLVLCTMLLMDVTDRKSLPDALALVWDVAKASPTALDNIDADGALSRLIGKGYLEETDGRLYSCSCAVIRAQRGADLTGVVNTLAERLNATLEVRELLFRDLLSFARHADQAEVALRSPDEQQASARSTSEKQMSDATPFDLRSLCAEQARRADIVRDDVDVYWDSAADEPLWMAGPGMPYEYLVRELLTNAISAASGNGQPAMVWLSLKATDAGSAALTVSDNGPGFPADFRTAFDKRQPVQRPERPGRGIGFHSLRMYAEAHGATYRLAERPGGGAAVTVWLPLMPGPSAQEPR